MKTKQNWRLQGFPDEMFDRAQSVNSDAQLYRQAGNSVTVTVVYTIGMRIVESKKRWEAKKKNDTDS